VWIRACWTAFANVVFGRPLSFDVTRKDGRDPRGVPWGEIWPQLTAMAVLSVALVIGVVRVFLGTADGTGTLVNTAWVLYDLVVLSVIVQAARYRGPVRTLEKETHGTAH
jgi:cellulose synthase (UDP-forming)